MNLVQSLKWLATRVAANLKLLLFVYCLHKLNFTVFTLAFLPFYRKLWFTQMFIIRNCSHDFFKKNFGLNQRYWKFQCETNWRSCSPTCKTRPIKAASLICAGVAVVCWTTGSWISAAFNILLKISQRPLALQYLESFVINGKSIVHLSPVFWP